MPKDKAPKAATPLDPTDPDDVTDFDLDAWIDDSKPPQRSMTVYRRADLRSELDEIERQIQMAESQESSSADAGLEGLKAKWNEIAEKISNSAITFTARAVTDDAAKQARADAKKEDIKAKAEKEWDDEDMAAEARDEAEDEAAIEGLEGEERDALIRRRVIEARRQYINARVLQAVEQHLLVRLLIKPKMTVEQLRSLSEQIGSAQRDRLMGLPMQAMGEARPVSAPFSQRASRARSGGTSSKRSGQQGRGGSRR